MPRHLQGKSLWTHFLVTTAEAGRSESLLGACSPAQGPSPREQRWGPAASSLAGALLVLLLAAALSVRGAAARAPGLEAVLVGVASLLLPALLFLALAFRGFLAALFLLGVLLFMGGQRVLNCVN